MLSPHIYAALVQERHRDFLAQAETDRRNRRARPRSGAGAAATGRPAVLRAVSAVLTRRVRADLVRREPGALEYEIAPGPAE
jgi:hypothetical protein